MIRAFVTSLLVTAMLAAAPYTVHAEDELTAGQSAFNMGQYEEALKHFDASVDASPTTGEPHFWRAKCLAALGRTKEAGGEYRMALLLSNDKAVAEESKAQLKQLGQAVPEGNVESEMKMKKKFVLETRKLDWNLDVATTKNLQKTLEGQNSELASLIHGRGLAGGAVEGPRVDLEAGLKNGPVHAAALGAQDNAELSKSDIVIILDRSGSMGMADCPRMDPDGAPSGSPQNRLLWSVEEMTYFSRQICAALPHGFTFITFDFRPSVFDIRTAAQFDRVLASLQSGGGTSLEPALAQAYARHALHPDQPLLIAVVSDCQIDVADSLKSMVAATHRYPLPKGVFISLLQVGITAEGWHQPPRAPGIQQDPFYMLGHLTQAGGAYDGSQLIPFSQLRKEGLGRCILSLLRAHTPKVKTDYVRESKGSKTK